MKSEVIQTWEVVCFGFFGEALDFSRKRLFEAPTAKRGGQIKNVHSKPTERGNLFEPPPALAVAAAISESLRRGAPAKTLLGFGGWVLQRGAFDLTL